MMADATPPAQEPTVPRGKLALWITAWVLLILVMSWFSIRKAFIWAGEADRYQQETGEKCGPGGTALPQGGGAEDGQPAGE